MNKPIAALGALAVLGAAAPVALAASSLGDVPASASQSDKVKPKTNAVVYTTKGKVTYDANATVFPPGTNDEHYAVKVTDALACNGQVRVTIYRGTKQVNRKTVRLKSDCSYLAVNTVSRKKAFGTTSVKVKYIGGDVLASDSAPTKKFKIKKKHS